MLFLVGGVSQQVQQVLISGAGWCKKLWWSSRSGGVQEGVEALFRPRVAVAWKRPSHHRSGSTV